MAVVEVVRLEAAKLAKVAGQEKLILLGHFFVALVDK
ncbi:hypothetical protein SAMN05518855_101923 [Paenibacillus sp. CF384]|nr:hypothetical protein SAMN05518855_101923 [Paenibacillus sp. CF384]